MTDPLKTTRRRITDTLEAEARRLLTEERDYYVSIGREDLAVEVEALEVGVEVRKASEADRKVEELWMMSDEEVRQLFIDEGLDPDKVANETREMIVEIVQSFKADLAEEEWQILALKDTNLQLFRRLQDTQDKVEQWERCAAEAIDLITFTEWPEQLVYPGQLVSIARGTRNKIERIKGQILALTEPHDDEVEPQPGPQWYNLDTGEKLDGPPWGDNE